MLDDHKYSLRRKVAYSHPSPAHIDEDYGPKGPERTYGIVTEVHLTDGEIAHWEYTVVNSFTEEVCRVTEDEIFHGADSAYLDMHRRDGIRWTSAPPETAVDDPGSKFWKNSLKDFIRNAVPEIVEREQGDERMRTEGRNLPLAKGDYIKVRGDLRPDMDAYHNLYGKILTVSPSEIQYLDVPQGVHGVCAGQHRVLAEYQVRLDSGDEVNVLDVEVKAMYTTNGQTVILNWRAATFLAESFGDHPPYEVHLDYLNGHLFTRSELQGTSQEDMGELLARMLYAKGLITWEEVHAKTHLLAQSSSEFLVDQLLEISRFDMKRNRPLTSSEIDQLRADDSRLKDLFGRG